MGRIFRLPESLSNRIAAGEVIERPAAAVKELIENSVDAGSTSIEIAVSGGGLGLMRVVDDGEGMSSEDAVACLERHATSKIKDLKDLDHIVTLGFRGEAIPSMASVSFFTLRTRRQEDEVGTEVQCRGGEVIHRSWTGMAPGTEVEVKDLFFNAPARRKFMKSAATELREISRVVSVYALSYPERAIAYHTDAKERFRFGSHLPLKERIRFLQGQEVFAALRDVCARSDGIEVHGVIAEPEQSKGTSLHGLLVLNGRPIRDAGLARAVLDACTPRLSHGKYPLYVLFLTLPLDRVDVNVHPAKSEVRFREFREIYAAVNHAVRSALNVGSQAHPVRWDPAWKKAPAAAVSEDSYPLLLKEPSVEGFAEGSQVISATPRPSHSPWRVRGQVRRTYVVCEDEDGLILVDQHAGHEAHVYATLCEALDRGPLPSQDLLIPQAVPIPFDLRDTVEALLDDLARLGFVAELFGPDTLLIRSAPMCAGESLGPDALEEIVHAFSDGRRLPPHHRLREVAKTMACRASVMAGEKMSQEEMEQLIRDIARLEGSSCPHGRPFAARFSFAELERLFKRK